MGLLSKYGESLSWQVVKVHQDYYKVGKVNLAGRMYHVYKLTFPYIPAFHWNIAMEGCSLDCDGEVVCPTLRKYFDLFVP